MIIKNFKRNIINIFPNRNYSFEQLYENLKSTGFTRLDIKLSEKYTGIPLLGPNQKGIFSENILGLSSLDNEEFVRIETFYKAISPGQRTQN